MFKKNKNTIQPPASPSADEIEEDIETFNVDRPPCKKCRRMDPSNNLTDWWLAFETFFEDLSEMISIQSELNGYKLKLESTKLDVETKSKEIKNDVNDNLEGAEIN